MKLGILGLPQSGKTTIFNALTGGDQPTTISGGRFEVHQAVVDVPDPRVQALSALFKPKKITYTKVTYADIAGVSGGSANGNGNGNGNGSSKTNGSQGFSGALLNQLAQMEGFIHVVRAFEHPHVPHPAGRVDPVRDLEIVEGELLLNDLITVERRLERLNEEKRKGAGRSKAQIETEFELFQRLQEALNNENPLRVLALTPQERKLVSGFGFLTLKPVLVVLNIGEDQSSPEIAYTQPASAIVALRGKLEMELAQLLPGEAELFMHEYGVIELGLNRVIGLSYQLMNLLTFYTVGEDEVRAWKAPRGATALEAAGVIHTDLAKGFIRAEVVEAGTLLELGGLGAARAKGKLRLEGKDYHVQDGEIVHVRFNL